MLSGWQTGVLFWPNSLLWHKVLPILKTIFLLFFSIKLCFLGPLWSQSWTKEEQMRYASDKHQKAFFFVFHQRSSSIRLSGCCCSKIFPQYQWRGYQTKQFFEDNILPWLIFWLLELAYSLSALWRLAHFGCRATPGQSIPLTNLLFHYSFAKLGHLFFYRWALVEHWILRHFNHWVLILIFIILKSTLFKFDSGTIPNIIREFANAPSRL